MPERLFTADQKINLAPRRYLADLGRLHQFLEQPATTDLLLIGRRHMRSNNSWMHNSQRLVKGKERCTLMISPKDAARSGLQTGDSAEVSTPTGRIVLPVEITDDIMPGVVSVPHGWGHDRSGIGQAVAAAHAGASINDVISDEQIDPLVGTSVLNGQSVHVKVWRAERQRKRA
jgi:anaerobic selenocysteine-containing dehydrogenase